MRDRSGLVGNASFNDSGGSAGGDVEIMDYLGGRLAGKCSICPLESNSTVSTAHSHLVPQMCIGDWLVHKPATGGSQVL